LGRIVEGSRKVAVRVVVVDAIDAEAVAFYERFGSSQSQSTLTGSSRS
jgi:hypothetical protein